MTGSWVPGADTSGFPLQHLPFGSCIHRGRRFLGTRIGASVLDLGAAVDAGGFSGCSASLLDALRHDDLSLLLGVGPDGWSVTRTKLGELLGEMAPNAESIARCLVAVDDVELALPFPVGDFVDFYSSIDHASNIGRMFRPDAAPLLPNWRHLPVGYHGRSGTIVVTGTPVTRPAGQRVEGDQIVFGPSTKLDIELEVGFVVGRSSRQGTSVPTSAMADHVFGIALVNDWSARDIQSWEYVPLGPFLGKSFSTTIAGWITPLAALENFRVDGPTQEPAVLPYLERVAPWGLDLQLSVDLRPAGSDDFHTICEVGFADTYWTPDQQLAHLTVNGASVRPGDLFASGTVSGPERHQRGSLIELTWNGAEPLDLGGARRTFLEDGDEVALRGCASRPGLPLIELGAAAGVVIA